MVFLDLYHTAKESITWSHSLDFLVMTPLPMCPLTLYGQALTKHMHRLETVIFQSRDSCLLPSNSKLNYGRPFAHKAYKTSNQPPSPKFALANTKESSKSKKVSSSLWIAWTLRCSATADPLSAKAQDLTGDTAELKNQRCK